jgi:hypothetical protein
MNTPEWLRPGVFGVLAGAVCVGVPVFASGFWVTDGTANDRALAMSHDDVIASLVPVCLDMARADVARADKLATIRAAATFLVPVMLENQQIDALMETGWATVPGSYAPDRDIAQACLKELDLESPGVR